MTEIELTKQLKTLAAQTIAIYGNYSYSIEFCKLNIVELYHLLIVNDGNTTSAILEIKELAKWNPKDKDVYAKIDSLYRFEERQKISFSGSFFTNKEGEKTVYILLGLNRTKPSKYISFITNREEKYGGESGAYIGLKFIRNYNE